MSTPVYDAMSAKHPDVIEAMLRERWSFAAASHAANEAIAAAKKEATAKGKARRNTVKKAAAKGASD
jgi:hypothetical protein